MHHFLTHLTFRIKQFIRLPADVVAHPQVRQNFPRNFIYNSLDGIFWMLGESFVSVSAILPVFASTLTQSPILIGLVPALINAGWFIPQLLTAGHVKRLPQKFPFAKRMGILERVPFIALPLTAFLLNWFPRQIVIWLFMIVVAWRGFASGMVALPWQEVIALVIPSEVRSRFFGFSRTAARSMAVIGSALAGLILANINFPNNYGLSFSIGAVFIWLSYFFFSQTVEPTASHKKIITEADQEKHLLIDIPGFKGVLKEDKNFRSYLLSRVFFQLGSMATGFFAVYGIKNFNLSDEQAAIFSGILFTSSIFGFFIWGLLGDRVGPRNLLLISDLVQMLLLALSIFAPSIYVYYLVFLLFGFAQAGYIIGELVLGMELGPEENRPIYLGLARTIPGVFILIAPIIGGAVVTWAGYQVMFLVALTLTLIGSLFLLRVSRHRRRVEQNESNFV